MKKTQLIDVYAILLAIVGLAAVVLRTIACLTSFDSVTMHFDDKVCINIANALVVMCTLFFATYLFTESKSLNPVASNENGATYIPAGLLSIALLFIAADRSVAIRQSSVFAANNVLRHLGNAVVTLAVVSVVAIFLMIFLSKNESTAKTLMCLGIVLYLCAYSAYLYFNRSVHPTNSPNKVIDQLAYLFAAMFFLFETRITLGRAAWRPYVSLGFMASLLTAYSAIPALLVYIGSGYILSDTIYETAVTLALCIFITSRVLLTKRLYSSEGCREAEIIKALFELREGFMNNKKHHSLAREEDNKEEIETVDAENYSFDIPPIESTVDADEE